MSKKVLIDVEDILTILTGCVAMSISALHNADESSGPFGDAVFAEVERNLDIFQKIAEENGIPIDEDGLRPAFEKYNAS